MHHPTRPTRALVRAASSLIVLTLLMAACSSGSEDSSPASPEQSTSVASGQAESSDDTSDSGSTSDLDCATMEEHLAVLRNVTGVIPQITDQEMMDVLAIDLDAVDEAIEGLRPVQDIEGLFGTSRETLDNFAANIQFLREGQYGEKAGPSTLVALTSVVADEVCK